MSKTCRYLIYLIGAICLTMFCLLYKYKAQVTNANADSQIVVPKIEQDDYYSQTIKIDYDNLNKIGIQFATFQNNNNNKGIINLKITNMDNNNVVFNDDLKIEDIIDNSYFYLSLDENKKSKNNNYLLEITGTKIPKKSTIGVYCFLANNNQVILNGKKQTYSTLVRYNCMKGDKTLLIYVVFYILIISLIECLKLPNKEGHKHESSKSHK